ncbi:MAG: winged helix-turn-helix transcriptional regulator [Rhizobiales bacterium]|nr:winged helix-turn-helix transcriptional regulator [Hyphomicrobiales bacterium]MBN9014889.1 winged helix-turn-helix transcriptional regulator [Hyphomicrobiales bacterium]
MQSPLLTTSRPELLDDSGDQTFRELLYAYFAFGRSLDAARAKFAGYADLSTTQYLILIAVMHSRQDEPLGINQLAERLYLSGAFVTIEVNKLVSDGLIEKTTHAGDRRRVQLAVTPAGIERLTRLAAFQRPVNDALFRTLSRDEFKQLLQLLNRLAADGDQAIKLASHIERTLDFSDNGPTSTTTRGRKRSAGRSR